MNQKNQMNSLIENLINGNLRDAKRQAKRFKNWEIRNALIYDYGYSDRKAILTADWLKGRDCFQDSCDAN